MTADQEPTQEQRETIKKMEVWVAEDHLITREALLTFLRGNGYTNTQSFLDGEELLTELKRRLADSQNTLPALIITDLQMPKVNGIQLIEELTTLFAHTQNQKPHIILLCGGLRHDDLPLYRAQLGTKVFSVLLKGQVDELETAIESALLDRLNISL
jgi:CheY-like chemotaxis protein